MTNFTLTTSANNFSGIGANIDTFSGPGGGIDTLNGGGGNDTFTIDGNQDGSIDGGAAFDSVFMQAGENFLQQTLTFTGVEQFVASSTNQYITFDQANAFSTIMAGAGGTDFFLFFQGDGGTINLASRYADGATLHVETSLCDSASNVTLTSADDSIIGGMFNDTFNGGGGADTMAGGGGNDLYYVDVAGPAGDQIQFEGVSGGDNDTVATKVSYTLAMDQHIETFKTTSNAGVMSINLQGNDFAQTIIGNAGNNVINGRGGNDQLIGLGGRDSFVFDRALSSSNVDHISDFAHGADKIRLDATIFSTLAPGALPATAFKDLSLGAEDADDRILYNPSNGGLFYDPDGAGGVNLRVFAFLDNHPTITSGDFAVVA